MSFNINQQQIEKATLALQAFHQKQSESVLLNEDAYIYTVITLKKVPEKKSVKPVLVSLPHPIYDSSTSICLIVKDAATKTKIKETLVNSSVKFDLKILTIESLRLKFKPYEAKRMLKKSYDLFVSDDRLIPSLPKLLGSKFFQAKKLPYPISLSLTSHIKNIGTTLQSIIHSTQYTVPLGTTICVRTSLVSQSPSETKDNVLAIVDYLTNRPNGLSAETISVEETKAIESNEGKISNNGKKNKEKKKIQIRARGKFAGLIQAVSLKTAGSVSLPVWCELPNAPEAEKQVAEKPAEQPATIEVEAKQTDVKSAKLSKKRNISETVATPSAVKSSSALNSKTDTSAIPTPQSTSKPTKKRRFDNEELGSTSNKPKSIENPPNRTVKEEAKGKTAAVKSKTNARNKMTGGQQKRLKSK